MSKICRIAIHYFVGRKFCQRPRKRSKFGITLTNGGVEEACGTNLCERQKFVEISRL